jgi:hypothetical protein
LPKHIRPIPSTRNKFGYQGLKAAKQNKIYAEIFYKGKGLNLGSYNSVEEAAKMFGKYIVKSYCQSSILARLH